MDLAAFNPPDYHLIDDNPELFKQQFQAFYDALNAHQSDAGDLQRINDELKLALSETQSTVQSMESAAKQSEAEREAIVAQHAVAVAAYRQAVLNGDPTLPPDLIQGATIDELNGSLDKAKRVVDYIRNKVNTPGGAGAPGSITPPGTPPRVPAGAPGRTLPDVAGMTAREKLVFGTSRLQG